MNCALKKALVLFGFVCFFSSLLATAEEASVVRATRVDGAVLKNGTPLKEGEVIHRDDSIETKTNSAALLAWSNGSMIEVYPDTAITLRGVTFEGEKKQESSLLALGRGRIFVKAQVPENMFCQFEITAGGVTSKVQGAEFAMKYDEAAKQSTIWSLLGTVLAEQDVEKVRIEDGQQASVKAGTHFETPTTIPEKVKDALVKTSKQLGGSLLVEDESASTGGPLSVRIGGVLNRRGSAPYTANFKVLPKGGSGKIKYVRWRFGDGEEASGRTAKHTFTQGVYVIVVQIEDENGQKATAQLNISVEENCGC